MNIKHLKMTANNIKYVFITVLLLVGLFFAAFLLETIHIYRMPNKPFIKLSNQNP